jgi:hypothetical protein
LDIHLTLFLGERFVVVVEDAGVAEVNGEYHFDRVIDNTDCYSRKGNYHGKEVTFGIWKHNSTWCISQCKNMTNPVTDPTCATFYYALNSNDSRPPLSWKTTWTAHYPIPQVSIVRVGSSILTKDHSRTSLTETVNSLYQNENFKDFTIVYQDEEIRAHKCILGATSLYFQRMFSNEWKEKNCCEIANLESVTVADFKIFLEFLYLQSFNSLDKKILVNLGSLRLLRCFTVN